MAAFCWNTNSGFVFSTNLKFDIIPHKNVKLCHRYMEIHVMSVIFILNLNLEILRYLIRSSVHVMFYVNYRVKFSVEIPGLSTAGAREIENSRLPHQVVAAQVLSSSVCSQIPRASDLSSRDKITLDQQLCKRVSRGLKTGPIEHNFVRLTKEQVSTGGFSLLCAA